MRVTSEMDLVAYFLSRCGSSINGKGTPSPPAFLEVHTWQRAYAMFFGKLGGGRTLTVFRNSLKNARDAFDSHLLSGRIGWRVSPAEEAEPRQPQPLNKQKADVLRTWSDKSEAELWHAVREYADPEVRSVDEAILSDLAAELDPERTSIIVRTEGGRKVILSMRIERDPSLRAAAIRLHGTDCCVCGFSFSATYGPWGQDFAVVHHLVPFGGECGQVHERATDPRTDLAVVCANCHCMIHRRRNKVLTIEELKSKLVQPNP